MFDLPELLNRATNMFKGSGFEGIVGTNVAENLTELGIAEYGLDAAQLGDIQSTLANAGVDLSALSETQIGELLASVKENGSLDGLDLSQLISRSSN